MMKRQITAIIFAVFCLNTVGIAAQDVNNSQLYHVLDSLLEHQESIIENKQTQLENLRNGLADQELSSEHLFKINERMYDIYMAFNFDSAYYYINKNVTEQRAAGNHELFAESAIRMAHILSVAGIFNNACQLLNEIRPQGLSIQNRIDYYNQQSELNLYRSEMASGTPFFMDYIDSVQYYRQQILNIAPHDSYDYVFNLATYTCEKGDAGKAIKILEDYLPKLKLGERKYSIITSTIAYFYSRKNQLELQERYLLLSAISDMRGCILENNSLREISSILMERGEHGKAYGYLRRSSVDAKRYGSRLRSLQVARLAPLITQVYDEERAQAQQRTTMLLIIISIIALMLIGTVLYILQLLRKRRLSMQEIHSMNKALEKQNATIESANNEMKESNRIKDEYIGRFMELSSQLIFKGEERQKKLNRLARERKLEELYAELKSNSALNEGVRMFYQNFDAAFLNIFPNFVTEVNKLMTSDNQFETEDIKKLSTELRVLALIRLGINDNQKIADILRSSIATIYTYRSRMKSKAIHKDTFEDEISLIATY